MNESTTAPEVSAAEAEKLACEVKFLLDAGRVLEEGRLTEDFRALFALGEDAQAIDVLYLETADKAFIAEGWVNRIRWKEGKKKAERTYKKRYPLDGADEAAVLAALRQAEADGFVLAAGGFEAELDWGYAKMTLSLTHGNTGAFKGYQSLDRFSAEDAAAFFEKTMPGEERDWGAENWAASTLGRAQLFGPIRVLRYRGQWDGVGVTAELCPLGDGQTIAELSFKADDWKAAAETRERLMVFLDARGMLIHGDSLKTQAVLSACLLA